MGRGDLISVKKDLINIHFQTTLDALEKIERGSQGARKSLKDGNSTPFSFAWCVWLEGFLSTCTYFLSEKCAFWKSLAQMIVR